MSNKNTSFSNSKVSKTKELKEDEYSYIKSQSEKNNESKDMNNNLNSLSSISKKSLTVQEDDKTLTRTKVSKFVPSSKIQIQENKQSNDIENENQPQLSLYKYSEIGSIEDNFLLNEENDILIENYMNKMGIKEKVNFSNNLNRLKIYKKILEENSNNPYTENYKLIDLSNKLLSSHEEISRLTLKLKESESKNEFNERKINELTQENLILKKKVNENEGLLSLSSQQINSNNQNNININFNLGNDNLIQNLTDENSKLKKFQNKIFEISKESDDMNTSIIDSIKNVNIIIEQFNISTKNDPQLKKQIENYLSKYSYVINIVYTLYYV